MVTVIIRFDFTRNEFIISFPTDKTADNYRATNKEARIFDQESKQDVWIPKPIGLRAIRSYGDALAVYFNTKEQAKTWSKNVLIGKINKTDECEVYITRKWVGQGLEDAIMSGLPISRPDKQAEPASHNKSKAERQEKGTKKEAKRSRSRSRVKRREEAVYSKNTCDSD